MIKAITRFITGKILGTGLATGRALDSTIVTPLFEDELADRIEKRCGRFYLAEEAAQRVQRGQYHQLSQEGLYTKERVICIPRSENLMVRSLPANPTPEDVYLALENSVRFPRERTVIPTKRFADEEITAWGFGKNARVYGEFLDFCNIKEMPLHPADSNYVDTLETPLIRRVWFDGVHGWSAIHAN